MLRLALNILCILGGLWVLLAVFLGRPQWNLAVGASGSRPLALVVLEEGEAQRLAGWAGF